jgi:hypothetical protein
LEVVLDFVADDFVLGALTGVSTLAGDVATGVLLAVVSRLMIESPASGGASGCLKYTGSRIETGTGWPWVFAGSNLRSREPFIAAESSAVNPEVSAIRVESGTMVPSLSMKMRSVTLP